MALFSACPAAGDYGFPVPPEKMEAFLTAFFDRPDAVSGGVV